MEQTPDSGFFYGYIIVISSLLISIVMWGSRLSFGVFIIPLLDEFGWSRALTSAAFSVTWIGAGLLSIVAGRLNDRFGPRLIMTAAGCFLGLGYYLISTVSNITQLFIYYGVVNIGMSTVITPLMSTVARWFVKMRAFMSGIVLAGTGIALMLAVPLANRLILSYGWRHSYLVVGVVTFMVITINAQLLRRDPFKMGKTPYGYQTSKTPATADSSGMTLGESLHTRQLYLLGLVFFCSYLLYYLIVAHIILYAIGAGITSDRAILIVSTLGLAGIAGRILMGILADELGNKETMITCAILMIISFVLLLLSSQFSMLMIFAVAFGFGHGGMATMESPMTAHIFGLRAHGAILGIVFASDTVGGALGPVIAGYIFDLTCSYSPAFKFAAVITVVNLVAVLFLKPVGDTGTPHPAPPEPVKPS